MRASHDHASARARLTSGAASAGSAAHPGTDSPPLIDLLEQLGLARSRPGLVAALRDPEPLVRGHSAWALGRVGSAEAREALERSVATEDPYVRAEIERALETSPIEK